MSRLPSSTRALAVRHTARRPWRRAEPSAALGVAHPPGLSISAAPATGNARLGLFACAPPRPDFSSVTRGRGILGRSH
jgi:hypothetical protein